MLFYNSHAEVKADFSDFAEVTACYDTIEDARANWPDLLVGHFTAATTTYSIFSYAADGKIKVGWAKRQTADVEPPTHALQRLREVSGLTIEQAANFSGTPYHTWQSWEDGQQSPPGIVFKWLEQLLAEKLLGK